MKNRTGLVLLALLCVGIGIGMLAIRQQAIEHHKAAAQSIQDYSNTVVVVSDQLERQKEVNAVFEQDLNARKKTFLELTNSYTAASSNLVQVCENLTATEVELTKTQQELATREAKISQLETGNEALDQQGVELSTSLTNLTLEIAETQRKLAASEGDRTFLEGELKRLMAEKAQLERQFSDLATLRTQLAKLKEEFHIARRIQWMRRGLFAGTAQKGAEQLVHGVRLARATPSDPAYDLNAEVDASGTVKIKPAKAAETPPSQ